MDFQVAHNLDKFPGVQKETLILKEGSKCREVVWGLCRQQAQYELGVYPDNDESRQHSGLH